MSGKLGRVVVDADHHVQRALLLHRRGDDDLAHTPLEIGSERVDRAEAPRALEDELDPRGLPGDLAGSRGRGPADLLPFDHERVVARFDAG